MIHYPVQVWGYDVPADTKCYCVTRHMPAYAYVLPFSLMDGRVLWLCPNTYYATKALLKIYKELGGPPDLLTLHTFTTVAQRLARLCFDMEMKGVISDDLVLSERLRRLMRDGD